MFLKNISSLEKITLVITFIILFTGYYLFFTNITHFENYVQEDGIIEWLTVMGLLLGCFICFIRFINLFRVRGWWFLTATMALAILLLFVAGEEISWGQRIFNTQSPEFFKEKNSQQETNLHNLVVNGIKINKLVFSFGIIGILAIYLGILPILYFKNKKIHSFIDRSSVPVPRPYQVICFLLLFIITSLLPHEKKAELLECCAVLLFFLIVLKPANEMIFKSDVMFSNT